MRNFDWSNQIARLMGGIIESLIILFAVAVLAAVIFLLVRYLLVATRAAQLYVDQHQPPRPEHGLGGSGSGGTSPAPGTDPATSEAAPTTSASTTPASSAGDPTATAPTTPMNAAAGGVAGVTKPSQTRAKSATKPTTKPATTKAPPAQ
ncbi:MAG: hypothetical protein WED09_06470 [Homoserinimonas sp.]